MNDLLITSDSSKEVERMMSKAKEGMEPQINLTKIYSNVGKVREKYEEEIIECKRVLGIDQEKDQIKFDTSLFKIDTKKAPT